MNIKRQRLRYITNDFLASALGWCVFYVYRFDLTGHITHHTLEGFFSDPQVIQNLILSPFVWVGLFAFSGYYHQPYFRSYLDELQNTLSTVVVGTLLFFFSIVIDDVPIVDDEWLGFLKTPHVSPRVYLQILLTMFGCIFLPVYFGRYFITHRTNELIRKGKLGLRTLIIGSGRAAASLERELTTAPRKSGFLLMGCLTTGEEHPGHRAPQLPQVGDLHDLKKLMRTLDVEAFLLAPDKRDRKILYRQLFALLPYGLPIQLRIQPNEEFGLSFRPKSLTSIPMVSFGADCIPPFRRNVKRLGDIVVACLALLILSPLMLALMIIIPMDSKGSVFYAQERIGRLGHPFKMYKFRSMRTDAEPEGPQLSKSDDPRITRLGHYLRKYRLDELPQFWNVLRGDMSLVGPRPERAFYIDRIMEYAPHYSLLLQLRPGITSWGMVKYGYAGDVFQMVERMRYDQMYLENCTLAVDLKIIGYTIQTVITGKGI